MLVFAADGVTRDRHSGYEERASRADNAGDASQPSFYFGSTLYLIATVVSGFWPSYFGPLLTGGVKRPLVILILPIGDMILFVGMFGAAIMNRHRPEVHKRLIVAATVALAFAALGG